MDKNHTYDKIKQNIHNRCIMVENVWFLYEKNCENRYKIDILKL